MFKVSIVIPVFNEKDYILKIIEKVEILKLGGFEKEIVIVDDGSVDGTREILETLNQKYKVIFHQKNQGKGAALRTGFKNSSGEIIAIQDADLEYDPRDLATLISLVAEGQFPVIYGSRMRGNNPIGYHLYYFGNLLISKFTNFLYNTKLTDVETCYKVFKRKLLENLNLHENDFGFDVEFTAKLLKNRISIGELPISYSPRKFHEGKKINWQDGLKALWLLVKYRFPGS